MMAACKLPQVYKNKQNIRRECTSRIGIQNVSNHVDEQNNEMLSFLSLFPTPSELQLSTIFIIDNYLQLPHPWK